jgi:predicted CoA-binding protein
VSEAAEVLDAAGTVLLVDWPSAEVPDALLRAGHRVIVKAGRGPHDFNARELVDGEIVVRPLGSAPDHVDLVYAHRPEAELERIVKMASELGATVLWWQSGLAGPESKDPRGCWVPADQSRRVRELAESAGLRYVDDVYIVDAARA